MAFFCCICWPGCAWFASASQPPSHQDCLFEGMSLTDYVHSLYCGQMSVCKQSLCLAWFDLVWPKVPVENGLFAKSVVYIKWWVNGAIYLHYLSICRYFFFGWISQSDLYIGIQAATLIIQASPAPLSDSICISNLNLIIACPLAALSTSPPHDLFCQQLLQILCMFVVLFFPEDYKKRDQCCCKHLVVAVSRCLLLWGALGRG